MPEAGSEPWILVEPGSLEPDAMLELPESEARHLSGALRCRAGAGVVLADGQGRIARAELQSIARGRVEARVLAVELVPGPSGPRLELALGVLHGQAMDWAVQKAVELGVARVVPVLTVRSQLSRSVAARRSAHWLRVAEQALKQCHRAWAAELAEPIELAELAASARHGLRLVADRDAEHALPPAIDAGCSRALLLVGPEGGLVGTELELLESLGWDRVCLARHILRAETAAVAGIAMLGWAALRAGTADEPDRGALLS